MILEILNAFCISQSSPNRGPTAKHRRDDIDNVQTRPLALSEPHSPQSMIRFGKSCPVWQADELFRPWFKGKCLPFAAMNAEGRESFSDGSVSVCHQETLRKRLPTLSFVEHGTVELMHCQALKKGSGTNGAEHPPGLLAIGS